MVIVTGAVGTIVWEASTDNGTTWNPVVGGMNDTITVMPAVTTQYRAAVSSGSCPTAYSDTVLVSIDVLSVAGTANGSDTVCTGTAVPISLAGYTGTIQWQSSPAGHSAVSGQR